MIEKCFIHTNDAERDALIDAVIEIGSESPPISTMVRDQYGNYVIQKILDVSTRKQRERLINRIVECVPGLRKLMFGKHIIAKIEQLVGKASVPTGFRE